MTKTTLELIEAALNAGWLTSVSQLPHYDHKNDMITNEAALRVYLIGYLAIR